MARWRLTGKHYLAVEGCEWEHREQDATTGEEIRKRYPVPKYLDPEDPRSWNYRETGEVIVCHKGKGEPRDLIFIGMPTMEMEPLDDEAEKLSAKMRKSWAHPIDSLPDTMEAPLGTL